MKKSPKIIEGEAVMDVYKHGKFMKRERQTVILNGFHWKDWLKFSRSVKAKTKMRTYKDKRTHKRLMKSFSTSKNGELVIYKRIFSSPAKKTNKNYE
jgi:hypothetical protein